MIAGLILNRQPICDTHSFPRKRESRALLDPRLRGNDEFDCRVNNTETKPTWTNSQSDADGGVDVTFSSTSPSGEVTSRTFDLDLNESGDLIMTSSFTGASGNTSTHTHTMDLATFLGAAEESLTVAEVTETLLEMRGVDVTLTGIADLLA